MKNSVFSDIVQDFIGLFFAGLCKGCRRALVKGEDILCSHCVADLPRCNYHLDPDNPLKKKFDGRVPVSHAVAFLRFRKKGIVQQMLHTLKYRGNTEIGVRLGMIYGEEISLSGLSAHFDLIVPVPLHISRLRQRGYNQSEQWAMGLSVSTRLPVIEKGVVERIYKTSTQTRRTKLDRWENVREVFHVKKAGRISGRRVLLVDDVVTTGATLEACSQVLLDAGCASVGIACIAVA